MKSGSDFHQFSKVTVDFREDPVDVEVEAINVTKEFEPDKDLQQCLDTFTGRLVWNCSSYFTFHLLHSMYKIAKY